MGIRRFWFESPDSMMGKVGGLWCHVLAVSTTSRGNGADKDKQLPGAAERGKHASSAKGTIMNQIPGRTCIRWQDDHPTGRTIMRPQDRTDRYSWNEGRCVPYCRYEHATIITWIEQPSTYVEYIQDHIECPYYRSCPHVYAIKVSLCSSWLPFSG